TDWADFPPGPIHVIVYIGYVPVAVWILTVFFAMDDLTHGLSLFMVYIYLPVFVLWVLNWPIGFWNPLLRFVGEYLPVAKLFGLVALKLFSMDLFHCFSKERFHDSI